LERLGAELEQMRQAAPRMEATDDDVGEIKGAARMEAAIDQKLATVSELL
jgi:hypothetical protein